MTKDVQKRLTSSILMGTMSTEESDRAKTTVEASSVIEIATASACRVHKERMLLMRLCERSLFSSQYAWIEPETFLLISSKKRINFIGLM